MDVDTRRWRLRDRRRCLGSCRSLFRYGTGGLLLWQAGMRSYRPNDPFTYVEIKDGQLIAWAMMNGWSASIDKESGAFLKVLRTEVR